MRGQVTVEFLVVAAGLLAVYAVSFPVFASSFQKASNEFNSQVSNSIVDQVKWKASEVELLEEGSTLYSEVNSPFEFNFSVGETAFNVKRGVNVFQFSRTSSGVEIQLK
ncbi:MAG: hypothetical protein V1644_00700 [Candidatus Micrarchaeota archaeon]